ncbi:response regulator transcription factor [Celeribacter sp.]|uniref:response regulator transcription factor n=1 Tax=Celeribacter sp. TaxID=1890673 RepID=UPI003A90D1A3
MKLLLADDHDLVRDSVAAYLKGAGIEDVVTAASLEATVTLLREQGGFDLVLLDYQMPGMNGLKGLEQILREFPDTPTAIISGTASPDVARRAIDSGAAGFVPKSMPAKSIAGAVHIMVSGTVFAPFEFMQQKDAMTDTGLTPRETQVLRGLCEGKTNKEIAIDLNLSEVTIKLHVRTLCRKLDARNRTHAAMLARERGWFE